MGLNLSIIALTLPEGSEFPGSPQGMMDLNAQYLAISGDSDFSGVNYGSTEPAPADRDKPWFKTDISGNPIGWYGWNGSAWTAIPVITPSGTTAQRPVAPASGTQYFDTTINCALIYYGAAWHTLSGSPGDIKHVAGTVLATVLTKNPGWSHYTAGIGKVLQGALADGSNAENNVGADTINLVTGQLPTHLHDSLSASTSNNVNGGGPRTNGIMFGDTSTEGVNTLPNGTTGNTGDGDDIDIRQATRCIFALIKD